MRERISQIAVVLLVMLLIPAWVTLTFSDDLKLEAQKDPDLEDYLAGIVYRQVLEEYPFEAVKAQVVLARSTVWYQLSQDQLTEEAQEASVLELRNQMDGRSFKHTYEKIQEAVNQTREQVLTYQGAVCPGAFHRVSAGQTRDGEEVLKEPAYAYLTSMESTVDQESEDYLTGHYFTPDFLEKQFASFGIRISFQKRETVTVKHRDCAGYVSEVEIGDTICTGEEVRQMLQLSSSSFTVESYQEKIRFLCRGVGHGLGMSQYGALRMAQDGKSYREILSYYFPESEILEMECE